MGKDKINVQPLAVAVPMFVFCEDCGEKNTITPDQFQDGRVTFQCQACGYNNNYLLSIGVRNSKVSSSDLYARVITMPGTLGGFVYHKTDGVLQNDLKELLNNSDISGLGSRLFSNLGECRIYMEDAEMMTFYVSGRTLVVKCIDPESIMVVACETNEAVSGVEKTMLEKNDNYF